jgi:Activator of Hsp90 ATPase homolog 1-like protein
MNGMHSSYGDVDRWGSPSSRPLPRPARRIMLDVRRCEREAAPFVRLLANHDGIGRHCASWQGVTPPDWTLVLSALKTLLETGKPLAARAEWRQSVSFASKPWQTWSEHWEENHGEVLVRLHDLYPHYVGSTYRWEQNGATIADPDQIVLESDLYRRLSYTWHTFTPEWAKATGFSEEFRAKAAAEPRSKVTFDLEPVEETVKLSVRHDGFEPGSTVLEGVSEGWPRILSDLKTLLETAEVPGASAYHSSRARGVHKLSPREEIARFAGGSNKCTPRGQEA